MPAAIVHVGLEAPAALLPGLADFYGSCLGLRLLRSDAGSVGVEIGETVLDFRPGRGTPFYHVALLVPGDRFEAALAWADDRVELLPDRETGTVVFDFTNWDAKAVYFHDPAGSIVELIAHRGVGGTGATGLFTAGELLGLSEVGLVGDPPSLAEALGRELGLEVWDGTVDGEGRLAFVGEKARTLILCRAGRPWLPTGRPAEAHPVDVVLAGGPEGELRLDAGGRVSRRAAVDVSNVGASPSSRHEVKEAEMARPVTLFTGQWADLPLAGLAEKLAAWGFDGVELACWGDHFEVDRAIADPGYVKAQRELLERHGLGCWAIGAHLVGQAVADPIDARHRGILPPEVWGDGDPEGVRRRAAERMKDTARAAAALGVTVVNGFTGSPIWHLLYSFPPNDFDAIERGYEEFAERWGPIIDVFDEEGVRFALEVHPTEIAYDFVTTRRALEAVGRRPGFGINLDPSHFAHQFLDTAAFAIEFADRIYHVHVKDSRRFLDGRSSILGGHLNFGEPQRGWDFVSPGHGDVDFEAFLRALNRIGYTGPLSIEWEDSGMDREWGAQDALAFVRRTDFAPSAVAFDAAMQRE